MPKIVYTGSKPKWLDNSKAPGVVWSGQGDAQEVSDAAWQKLKAHADIFAVVVESASPAAAAAVDMKPADLEAMDDDAVRALAKAREYNLRSNLGSENLRKKFAEAEAADSRIERA